MRERRRIVGEQGERLAAGYLQAKGYEIVERNYRTRRGEIDLIARRQRELVFVEVRTRTTNRFGTPAESVDGRKQKKLRELALAYLQQKGRTASSFRFDVIAITCPSGGDWNQAQILHIEHAF
jgi:putative endonuclease